MNICFVGAGYVGLTSAAVLAKLGNKVWVADIDEEKVNTINDGQSPFYEPGLGKIIAKQVNSNNLVATTDLEQAVAAAKVIFIAVGTPVGENGQADLNQVETVINQIADCLGEEYKLVVIKSTVPPGTTRRIAESVKKKNPAANFGMAFCPEFLRPGQAIEDTLNPDRIVIGADSDKAFELLEKIHRPLETKIIRMSPTSAEIVKYAANSYLALRIGFIDQIASLAEQVNADVKEVITGIGSDERIGNHYWYPGIGYGGYCFPKDVLALNSAFQKAGLKNNLFAKLARLNKNRPRLYVKQLEEKLGGLKGKPIGVLGLTAKPETDDMRGSQAIVFINSLLEKGTKVKAYDPKGMENAREIFTGVEFCNKPAEVAKDTTALCILCEWEEFATLDWQEVADLMAGKVVFDAKRMFEPAEIKQAGLDYMGVGRGIEKS